MDNNMAATADLESVRKIHRTLIEAVKTAESAVHAQLAQRRFWLEEICSNLDEEGGLQATSIWKRPIHVKTPLAKKSTTKTAGLKRKKTSLESSETKPAKNPRKKKSGAEGTDKKPQPKKNPTVKIKMRASSLSSDRVASSPDTADTESQKHDDEDSTGEYRVDLGSYHSRHPSADQNSDWDSTANNPLEMMATVAYGANRASYLSETHVHESQPMIAPRTQRYDQQYPQQHHYAPHGVRTYTSLEDVGASDDDSDQDKF